MIGVIFRVILKLLVEVGDAISFATAVPAAERREINGLQEEA
ncbi:hypothetical protein [Bradyrhizobium sp. USDA 4353]